MTRAIVNATWDDVPHLTDAQKKAMWAAIPEHERDARAKGIPVLGSGKVFPVAEERITEEAFEIPPHWKRLGAMDFGWDHPFAAVELAHDADSDVVHVVKAYRVREQTPVIHAAALKPWGDWLPWMWPRDGRRETLEGAGVALAKQYRTQGLAMHLDHAQFEDGSVSVEAGLMDMLDRMKTDRFKVFKHLVDWFSEFRLYHRKDGLVVKLNDDLMAATRYGCITLRFAKSGPKKALELPPPPVPVAGAQGWMGRR